MAFLRRVKTWFKTLLHNKKRVVTTEDERFAPVVKNPIPPPKGKVIPVNRGQDKVPGQSCKSLAPGAKVTRTAEEQAESYRRCLGALHPWDTDSFRQATVLYSGSIYSGRSNMSEWITLGCRDAGSIAASYIRDCVEPCKRQPHSRALTGSEDVWEVFGPGLT